MTTFPSVRSVNQQPANKLQTSGLQTVGRPSPANGNLEPKEIELKLALQERDATSLAAQLVRTPLLARRRASRDQLHNVYYDTPGQHLRQAQVALRMRRVTSEDAAGAEHWLQTLKMGGRSDSALSQRGEWETQSATGAKLDAAALQATPWAAFDPSGALFAALQPCFVTAFERTRWQVKRRDGSHVEVALDIGKITAGPHHTQICELEIELQHGPAAALFEVARQLAGRVSTLPESRSKSARGYALAEGLLDQPRSATLADLNPELGLPETAARVLKAGWGQFTGNLLVLRRNPAPEVVHQARVGWRRFKSALRFFKSALVAAGAAQAPIPHDALAPLLAALGELRDLDVACLDTLPKYEADYLAGDDDVAGRAASWQALLAALQDAAKAKRLALVEALSAPIAGMALLETTQWLEQLGQTDALDSPSAKDSKGDKGLAAATSPAVRDWAKKRLAKLDKRLQKLLQGNRRDPGDAALQHAARIEAKRLRYATESLLSLLPSKGARQRVKDAMNLQTSLGLARDLRQAGLLASQAQADPNLVAFLRGLAVGYAQIKSE